MREENFAHFSEHLTLGMTEEFYRLALDSLTETIIYTLDRNLSVTYANRAAFDFIASLGLPINVIGQRINEVFPSLRSETVDRYKKIISTGESDQEIVSYSLPDREFIAEVKRFPLKKNNDIIGILVSVNDITERHKVEHALQESVLRFDQVSRLAGEWLWETDADGRLVYSSPSVEKILGFKADDLSGKSFFDLFSSSNETEPAVIEGIYRRKETFRGLIIKTVGRDERELSLEVAGEPMFSSGAFSGYRGVALDITDRLQYEENLSKFKLAVDNASDHVMITDENGVILYANKAATEMTGYSLKEMVGARPSLWGGLMPAEFYRKLWKTIKEDKKTFVGEVTNRKKTGVVYIAELKISPITDSRGSVKFFVGIERDITTAKEIDRAKTEFVSLASHQLRTPLSIINWYVSEILSGDEPVSDRLRGYAEEIKKGNSRMIDLVNALLDVSRIDTGSFLVSPEPVIPCKLLTDVASDFKKPAEDKGVTISVNCPKDQDIARLDIRLFRMIIQNLVSNAVKYTSSGGSVSISIERENGHLIISVKDTGIGIPKEEQKGIFTKFFRASNAKKVDSDGNGLGLYLAKRIVDAIGGRIWFESSPESGSEFFIRLSATGVEAVETKEENKNEQKESIDR